MKKWALIVFISCWLWVMLAFSGGYHSHRTAVAWYENYKAPGERTARALQDAKRSDRWHIFLCELVLGAVLVWPVLALVRLDRQESNRPPQTESDVSRPE